MGKKKEKPAAAAAADSGAPKKRSKLRLVLLAGVPLVLAGGGYAGWTFVMGGEDAAHASEGADAAGHEGADAMHVPALPLEIKAETSFTYSFALSELLKDRCGAMDVPSLKAASEDEAHADGMLVNLSWVAAVRRAGTVTEKSCEYMLAEVNNADGKAGLKAQEAKAALAKESGEGGGGHH